ncbi:MAG: hypothetical protein HYR88_13075 [Verrucomicrobia bacterium]|nr:hypothetical protein [Verrucomicrobiota bacterium]MBI3870584.1 hypothetical protein [Verrucomicrobiota bacterium]
MKTSIFLLSLLLWAQNSRAANLIVNGGFEAGTTGWYGSFGLYGTSPTPYDGKTVGVLVDITHSSVNRTLTQTIHTQPGASYKVAFALRLPDLFEIDPGVWVPVAGDSEGGSATIEVRWNDRTLSAIPVLNRNSWKRYSLQTVANTDTTELNFYNAYSTAWPFIDGVSVVAIPEPSVFHLFAAVGAVLGFRYRARPSPSSGPPGQTTLNR